MQKFEVCLDAVEFACERLEEVPLLKNMNQVVELVVVLESRTECVIAANFVRKVLPIGFFELPVLAEESHGENRRIPVLAPVLLDVDEAVDFFD